MLSQLCPKLFNIRGGTSSRFFETKLFPTDLKMFEHNNNKNGSRFPFESVRVRVSCHLNDQLVQAEYFV